jgi:2-polyprenyl-3-methyl-5-hydroxy-6-metoxy-1,4-benzoquinol methylase
MLESTIDLFPEDVISRGINANYKQYLFVLQKVLFPLHREHKDISKVLDIGAGVGIYLLILSRLGVECHAIDTWNEYEDQYNNRMGNKKDILERFERNNVKVKECDILSPPSPFIDGEFDLVLFMDVLEHLATPKSALKEISRVLHRGGYLVLETPNTASLSNRLKALFGKSVYANLDYWSNADRFFGHIREYTAAELKWMLNQCGFECVKIKKTDASLFATPIAKKKDRQTKSNDTSWHSSYSAMNYDRSFRVKSVRDILRGLYLTITFIVPAFRETTIVVARKI